MVRRMDVARGMPLSRYPRLIEGQNLCKADHPVRRRGALVTRLPYSALVMTVVFVTLS